MKNEEAKAVLIEHRRHELNQSEIGQAIDVAIQALSSQVDGGWIRVEDGLPEDHGRFLCWVTEQNDLGKSGYVWNCCFHFIEKMWSDSLKPMHVTHWQPLPSPPKQ